MILTDFEKEEVLRSFLCILSDTKRSMSVEINKALNMFSLLQ